MKIFALSLIALSLAACSQATPDAETSKTPSMPGAYMIVSGSGYAAADLAPYAATLPPIYKKYGGYYVAFSTDYTVLEGSPDAQAILISAWPNADAAKAFWDSPEYRESIKLRDGIGKFDVVIVPAIPAPPGQR